MDRRINYFELKKETQKRFLDAGIDEISDFDWICCEVTGKKRSELGFIKEFTKDEITKINDAIENMISLIEQ